MKPNFNQLTYAETQVIETDAYRGFEDNGHSLLSPSGWHSWSKCVGSLNSIHTARAAGKDNCASVEGTCGHFFLEICLTLLIDPLTFNAATIIPDNIVKDIQQWSFSVSSKSHNSPEVQALAIKLANDLIKKTLNHEFLIEIKKVTDIVFWYVNQGYTLVPEMRVSIHDFLWHNASNGTSDIVLYNASNNHLIVADLKYGKGIEVFPKENGQLLIYCLGVIAMLHRQRISMNINDWYIDIVVCQPRINDRFWDIWQTNYVFIHKFSQEAKIKSVNALYAIGHPESVTIADYSPSIKSCQWCSHRLNCQPRLDKVETELTLLLGNAGIVVNNLVPSSASDLGIAQVLTNVGSSDLSKIHSASPFIIAVLKDVENEIFNRVNKGNTVDGVKLVLGRSSRSWDISDAKLTSLLIKYSIYDECIEIKLPSPAKFEKILVDKEIKTTIMNHVRKNRGSPVLALEHDRRKSIEEIKTEELSKVLDQSGIIINQ
jgi:hypothetical protein